MVWSKYFTKRHSALILVLFIVAIISSTISIVRQQHDLHEQDRTKTPSLIPTQAPQLQANIRRPAGVYAVFAIESNKTYSPEEVERTLANPVVSGAVLRERWENLEPNEGEYDFSRIDKVIQLASQENKKVQLILVPGFYTPQWVLR